MDDETVWMRAESQTVPLRSRPVVVSGYSSYKEVFRDDDENLGILGMNGKKMKCDILPSGYVLIHATSSNASERSQYVSSKASPQT